ncbi:MAG: peptidylprolyl isomerase [Stellaceae bacterium]
MLSRLSLAAVLVFGLGAGSAGAAGPAPTAAPTAPPTVPPPASALPPGNPVVARVDGVELHLADVEAAERSLPPQAQKLPFAEIYPILLDRLVDGALVTEAGRKEHLEQTPAVQQRLKLYEDHLIQQAYLEELLKGADSEDRLKARYQQFLKEQKPQPEVRARHILVPTEAEAKSIIAQLDKGADFATLAKKYSKDPGAASGGELGYFTRDDMVPAFSAAAFALPVGKYTESPVKTEFGWHVILVEDRRVKEPPSFAEARPQLTRLVAHDIIAAKLKELHDNAKIETYGLDGKPLPAAE